MYSFNSRVRYSELNHKQGTLKISSIINYFQDCSTFQSEDLNIGLSYLHSNNRVWILNSWQLQILNPTKLGDNIVIGTWAYDMKGFYGYRNFIMKDVNENVLVVANSVWVYIDTETGRPTKIPDDHAGYELEPSYPMEYAERKVELPKSLTPFPTFLVQKSNIDSYNHVNNGQYIKMAEEYLQDDFFVRSMRVEYKMQAVINDEIVPMVATETDCIKVVLTNKANKPYAVIEFQGNRAY